MVLTFESIVFFIKSTPCKISHKSADDGRSTYSDGDGKLSDDIAVGSQYQVVETPYAVLSVIILQHSSLHHVSSIFTLNLILQAFCDVNNALFFF